MSSTPPAPESHGLPEDGEARRGSPKRTVAIPIAPPVWRDVVGAAERASIPLTPWCAAAFALLLQRLCGAAPAVAVARGPSARGDFVTLAIHIATASDFLSAARQAAAALVAHGGGSGRATSPYRFLVSAADDLAAGDDSAEALSLALRPPRDGAEGALRLAYDPVRFSHGRMASFAEAYLLLLSAVSAEPGRPPAAYAIAPRFDRARTRPQGRRPERCALGRGAARLDEVFATAAALWSDEPAAIWPGDHATFAEIAASADQVVRALAESGAGADSVIAFRLPAAAPGRALLLFLVTQIAAYRFGSAILPIGQLTKPAQALAQMEAAGANVMIDAVSRLDVAPDWVPGTEPRAIAGFPGATLFLRAENRGRGAAGAAVLLPTSGTTGVPKLIRLTHPMLIGMLDGVIGAGIWPEAPTLIGSNISFDMAFADLWAAWSLGQPVVLLETELRSPAMLALARNLGARVLSLSPTTAAASLTADRRCFEGFHTLLLVGEVLPRALARQLASAAPSLSVVNGYGPAETAILTTLYRVGDGVGPVPLGPALSGYTALVADPATGSPLPRHWPGEFLITGPTPSAGYVDAGMTAARFIPVHGEAERPFFKTGDLGWIDEDGQVRFAGRADRQCKINGVRIELDGVEHVVAEVPGVGEVAALVLGQGGAAQVVIAVRATAGADDLDALPAAILAHCRVWLPRAAVPARIRFVEAMPTGASGKTLHRVLKDIFERCEPNAGALGSGGGRLPEPGSIEDELARIWAEQLGGHNRAVPTLHVDDDLFDKGATSLDVIAVAERIFQRFALYVPDDLLFVKRTLSLQAECLRGKSSSQRGIAFQDLHFRLTRRGVDSRGAVLGPPAFHGNAFLAGVIAAHAFPDFDVWGSEWDREGVNMLDGDAPIEVARAVAAAIVKREIPAPKALFGYSISGWMSWIVDRLLVAQGFDRTPIISLDGPPVHLYGPVFRERWYDKVRALTRAADGGPRAHMLLLRRTACGWDDAGPEDMAERWASLGVDVIAHDLRSVQHVDAVRSDVIGALAPRLDAFVSGDRARASVPAGVDVAGPGGTAWTMLAANDAPAPQAVRALMAEFPAGPVDFNLGLATLYIALASGDAELAGGCARRVLSTNPEAEYAAYGLVATLAADGRREEARALARTWPDWRDSLERRAEEPFGLSSWKAGPGSSDGWGDGLNFAAGFIAARSEVAARV